MTPLAHIAVATDFGEMADHAVAVAGRLAADTNARISLVNVFDPNPMGPAIAYPVPWWTASEVEQEMRERGREALESVRQTLLVDLPDVELVTLQHPNPAAALTDFAAKQGVDLLVVGTHGRQGIEHVLMGSVAERVVRHAPCSVLCIGAPPRLETFPRSLLVCTDFSPASEPALVQGAALAATFDAEVTLCHVSRASTPPLVQRNRLDRDKLTAAVEDALEAISPRFPRAHVAALRGDHPAETIAAHAAEHDIDLVVVATHGRTGLSRMVIGSVAEKVARLVRGATWIARHLST